MGNLAVTFRKAYAGMKTIFGRGGAKKAAQAAQKVARPTYQGPTISQLAERMPLALPAPSAEALAAAKPRVNVGKALNRNLDELRMSQVVTKDGTHVRYYRGAESDRILLKTADKGSLHQEWIYGQAPEQLTYIKTTGGGDRYIMKRNGNLVQVEKRATQYKDGINQTTSTNDLYFNDGAGNGFHRRDLQGFNGMRSAELEVRGQVEVTRYGAYKPEIGKYETYQEMKPYYVKNAGFGHNNRTEAQNLVLDLYHSHGEETAAKVQGEIRNARNMAENRFIDFDEALFNAYKA